MNDLLTSSARRTSVPSDPDARRPLAVGAALAGAAASAAVLLGCLAVAVVGWFASDAGSHGSTRDALRVGADAWLLGHGAHLQLETAQITVVPLGLTLFCGYVTFRLGRWAAATSVVDDRFTALTGTVALAGVYAVVATLTAVLASAESAETGLGHASLGAFLLAFAFGGIGIVSGSGRWPFWRAETPAWLLAVGTGTVSVVLLMLAAGSMLLLVALLMDVGQGANVLSLLHLGVPGGLLFSLVVASFVPNAAFLSGSYLLGPGFMVGSGTVVSPTAVVLGPVPAFPLLAALPDDGATPWWTSVLVGVPVLVAAVGVAFTLRRFPVEQYDQGALRGLAIGGLGGAGFALLTGLAGGSAGPGRMADVGVHLGETAVAAVVAMGVGGILGGIWMSWRTRRRSTPETMPETTRRPRRRPRPAGGGSGR